jgi:hypothetical protein
MHFSVLFIPFSHTLSAIVKTFNHFFKVNALYVYNYNTLYKWRKTLKCVMMGCSVYVWRVSLQRALYALFLELAKVGFMLNMSFGPPANTEQINLCYFSSLLQKKIYSGDGWFWTWHLVNTSLQC